MLLFATAAHPANIPLRAPDGQPWYGAAPYATGYPWPYRQLQRFPHRFSIIQQPNPMPYWRHARCIDDEAFAVADDEVRQFLIDRERDFGDATLYASEDKFNHLWDDGILAGLRFRLFAALWDEDPTFQPVWHGVRAWAKQYVSYPDRFESCRLFAPNMDSDL